MDNPLLAFAVGLLIAGVVGYVASQILFHTNAVNRMDQPQRVVLQTPQTPLGVVLGGIRSFISLFMILSTGFLALYMTTTGFLRSVPDYWWLLPSVLALFVLTLATSRLWSFGVAVLALLIEVALIWAYWNVVGGISYY